MGMKYHTYEETFIDPATHKLIRRFKGHAVVSLDQTMGTVHINLNYMPARAKHGEIVDIVNRALTDFNLPGTMYYGGRTGEETFYVGWLKLWNWKTVVKNEITLDLRENCGPDPRAVALGIDEDKEEPSNDYVGEPVPLVLTREDWTEIYDAVEFKLNHSPAVHESARWAKHLLSIMERIGPDSDIAAASGVHANG